ncbi:MAG TPA: beta-galactosidase GalA [Armatimonadota bacterium]|jgi:beta-galactosidase
MRRIAAALGVAALVSLMALPAPAAPRERLRMDAGWRFHYGELASYRPEAQGVALKAWKWKPSVTGEAEAAQTAAPAAAPGDWQDARTGDDVFQGRVGFAWFRTTLSAGAVPASATGVRLHFEGVDDNAVVYLNGIRLRRHEGFSEAFDAPAAAAWRPSASNTVAVLVENTAGMGGIIGVAAVEFRLPGSAVTKPAFQLGGGGWKPVRLPHDFVVEQPFDRRADPSHGFRPTGIGWYSKTFTIPAADRGRRLSLEFDGVYRDSTVWLNGVELGRHASGYTGFAYDATAACRFGASNTLVVRADARRTEGWWYEGGGIYRHVWLVKTSPVHVDHWGTFVLPTRIAPGPKPSSVVSIRTAVRNDSPRPVQCRVTSRIVDANGRLAGEAQSAQTVPAGGAADVSQSVRVANARLWSLESPHLYRVLTTVSRSGRALDTYETSFGIRTIRFDMDRGFTLNGKPVKIQGTCNHQDFAGIGVALPDRVHVFKLEKLKAMGSNAYRCSHHPYAPELMDACDRLGILVMDENRKLGDSPEILGQVESMVRRDRNHPSVIMWSMCNEERLQGSPEGARQFKAMEQVVKRLDASRPVSCAMNGGWGSGISLVEDLQGCNYNDHLYDSFHRDHPDIPMYGSETASTLTTRGEYEKNPDAGYVSAYNFTDWSWKAIADRPFMAGSFVWTGFDYRGEPTPYTWPCVNSHFGIMDTCGFPKDNYWYYLAWWGKRPMAHLMPHWNWSGKDGQDITVRCFSNCDTVELFLNGVSQGAKPMPRNEHVDWMVRYVPGRLSVIGRNAGKTAAADFVETTGAPAALRMRADRQAILADGEDVGILAVDVVDAKGRVVPTAGNAVTFGVSGPGAVIGVGNGDPSSHEADKASRRSAFNGHCLAIVQAGARPGRITVTASSPGLRPAAITMASTPAPNADL